MKNLSIKLKNKYNLKPKDIQHATILNREALHDKPFWRNDVVKAWCLSGGSGKGLYGGYECEYWIGFYDEDAPAHAGKIEMYCSSCEGMFTYKFKEFFDPNEIDNVFALELQKELLKTINWMLDAKIISIDKSTKKKREESQRRFKRNNERQKRIIY